MLQMTKGLILGTALCLNCLVANSATTVYSNNFNEGADSAWSSQLWTSTSSGFATRAFLGAWDDYSTTLTLTGLEAHGRTTVSLDLYVIGSVYGNYDPAIWSVTAGDKQNPSAFTFATNFSNVAGFSQAYPDSFPIGDNLSQTGAFAINPFDTGMPNGVTAYHLNFAFQHAASDLNITFAGNGFAPTIGPSYGRWGLDNVQVSISPVPEPGSFAMLLSGLVVIAGAASRANSRPANRL